MDDDHPAEDLRTANTARLRAGLAQFAVSDAGAGFQADSPAAVSCSPPLAKSIGSPRSSTPSPARAKRSWDGREQEGAGGVNRFGATFQEEGGKLGFDFTVLVDGRVRIVGACGQAKKNGVQVGDFIVAISGEAVDARMLRRSRDAAKSQVKSQLDAISAVTQLVESAPRPLHIEFMREEAIPPRDAALLRSRAGWLQKRSRKGKWQRRWFWLHGDFLLYANKPPADCAGVGLTEVVAFADDGRLLPDVSGAIDLNRLVRVFVGGLVCCCCCC